ncbi:MAG: hypothetical protein QG614_172 [Patescibacteria group bacterium]|nr:hypothetical protein [Patescibacteria group bacterium]
MTLNIGLNKKIILFVVDSLLFFGSLFFALWMRRPDIFNADYFFSHIPRFSILYIYFILALYVAGLYELNNVYFRSKIYKFAFYIIISYIVFGVMNFYLLPSDYSPKTVLLMQSMMLLIALVLWRQYSHKFLKTSSGIKAIILDDNVERHQMTAAINSFDYGIDLLDVNTHSKNLDSIKADLYDLAIDKKLQIIFADIKNEKLKDLLPFIYSLSAQGVSLYDSKILYETIFKKMPLSGIGYFWFYENVSINIQLYEFVKRIIDLLLAIPVFIVWVLLHPWVAYKIKKEDGGNIYSIQERLGRYNKKIYIKKYRTMTFTDKGVWLENSQNKVTSIGKFLRKTRIDELPQIFAVFRGDLSFIGPRTDIVNLGEKLANEIPYYNLRYSVIPGLSGWAQVNMDYQPRNVEDSIERLKYDLYYVKHRSTFLDLAIILKTIKTVLSREGS